MPESRPIAYEITLVSPSRADQMHHRRQARRLAIVMALAVAVFAPSPLTPSTRPFHYSE